MRDFVELGGQPPPVQKGEPAMWVQSQPASDPFWSATAPAKSRYNDHRSNDAGESSVAVATARGEVPEPEAGSLDALLAAVRACRACEAHLPLGARPVVQAAVTARILIVGQAPGLRVHQTGVPWDDPSGERLRTWMGVSREIFYDASRTAIIPMGYCYPGRGQSGDLPPRRECAQLWLDQLLAKLPSIELTLLIGQHAQRHFLGNRRKPSLAETIHAWAEYAPRCLPLPHPSPRNTPWFQRNAGFEKQLLPELRRLIDEILARAHPSPPIDSLIGPGGTSLQSYPAADTKVPTRIMEVDYPSPVTAE